MTVRGWYNVQQIDNGRDKGKKKKSWNKKYPQNTVVLISIICNQTLKETTMLKWQKINKNRIIQTKDQYIKEKDRGILKGSVWLEK